MKKSSLLAALTLAVALAAGCATSTSTSTSASTSGAKPYPLTTCVVSGDKLGAMGENCVFVYEGQEVKLCCKDCKKDFDKNPAKYITQLTAK